MVTKGLLLEVSFCFLEQSPQFAVPHCCVDRADWSQSLRQFELCFLPKVRIFRCGENIQ